MRAKPVHRRRVKPDGATAEGSRRRPQRPGSRSSPSASGSTRPSPRYEHERNVALRARAEVENVRRRADPRRRARAPLRNRGPGERASPGPRRPRARDPGGRARGGEHRRCRLRRGHADDPSHAGRRPREVRGGRGRPGQGEDFDPRYHEAMTMQEAEGVESGKVLQVFQKGCLLHGRRRAPGQGDRLPVGGPGGGSTTRPSVRTGGTKMGSEWAFPLLGRARAPAPESPLRPHFRPRGPAPRGGRAGRRPAPAGGRVRIGRRSASFPVDFGRPRRILTFKTIHLIEFAEHSQMAKDHRHRPWDHELVRRGHGREQPSRHREQRGRPDDALHRRVRVRLRRPGRPVGEATGGDQPRATPCSR